jgi:hypothetical protein
MYNMSSLQLIWLKVDSLVSIKMENYIQQSEGGQLNQAWLMYRFGILRLLIFTDCYIYKNIASDNGLKMCCSLLLQHYTGNIKLLQSKLFWKSNKLKCLLVAVSSTLS